MIKISDLFDVEYGNSFELNRLTETENGINFISRTAKNNGVSAKVERIENICPFSAGLITVSLGGTVLESFLQPMPFYTGYHIYVLKPKIKLTDAQKLYYCCCIRANKYRYNYGRQANKTLREIRVPNLADLPERIKYLGIDLYGAELSAINDEIAPLNPLKWKQFLLSELFTIKKGKRLTKANMKAGLTPFIGATEFNNGITNYIDQKPIHLGNTITIPYNGNSVAEAFYQPEPFWATDDVNVLYPKFRLNSAIALFFTTVIRQEKYRFNYGRKWNLGRMKESLIKLPVNESGQPDFEFMENYIKSLPYSSTLTE